MSCTPLSNTLTFSSPFSFKKMVEEETLGVDSRGLPGSHVVSLNQQLGGCCLSPEAYLPKILPKLTETKGDQEGPFEHKELKQVMFSPNLQRLTLRKGFFPLPIIAQFCSFSSLLFYLKKKTEI